MDFLDFGFLRVRGCLAHIRVILRYLEFELNDQSQSGPQMNFPCRPGPKQSQTEAFQHTASIPPATDPSRLESGWEVIYFIIFSGC